MMNRYMVSKLLSTFMIQPLHLRSIRSPRLLEAEPGVTPQIEGAEPPSREWIDFFVHTVLDNIQEDGSFGIPMYSFVADVGDLTIVPTAPDRKDEDNV